MIVPMKKVSLIIMGDKKAETLKTLRKLGIMHIEIAEGSGKKLEELKERVSLFESAIFTISETKPKKVAAVDADASEALSVAQKVVSLDEAKRACVAEQIALNGELERLKKWGDIDPAAVMALAEKGIDIILYETPVAAYDGLGEAAKTVTFEKKKDSVRFALIRSGSEEEEEIIEALKSFRVELPAKSTEEMKLEIENLRKQIGDAEEQIRSFAGYSSSIKKAIKACEKEIEFEVYATGMATEDLTTGKSKDLSVSYFTGYVEEDNLDHLKQVAKDNTWGLLVEDPTEEDNVPTKLKNNKFVSLIYPLTDFLGTVPGYFEYDISGWFLGFILLFFGMIFGDGGYGLLLTAAIAALIIKDKKAGKKVSDAYLLIGMFGISTIVWGTVTCTWFGLLPEQLPVWLQNLSIPVISNVYADKIWYPFWTNGEYGLTTAQNLQIFCFTLGLVQLAIAHIMASLRFRKSIKVLGDIGSLIELIGMYYVVLSFVVDGNVFNFGLVISGIPVGTIAIVMVVVGFILNFVFANYDGSIVGSIVESLKNIVSVLLGIFNLFSDIVSYIRLWAVGLAGAAISATVNELAGPFLGKFTFMILAIALLVFGHGLNMILNVLSVVVHGIRLNTLEFSSHLGMSWSGHKFKPFNENIE